MVHFPFPGAGVFPLLQEYVFLEIGHDFFVLAIGFPHPLACLLLFFAPGGFFTSFANLLLSSVDGC